MSKELYMNVTGCTNMISVNSCGGDFHGPCQAAIIDCESTTLDIGDEVTVDIGYSDDHAVVLTGYCKSINPKAPNGTTQVHIYDNLILAQDYLIVPDNIEEPLTYENIAAEDLVGNVLALASLTDYSGDHPGFTFGTIYPVKIQLIKAWDFVRQVCEMIAWWCYADSTGTIHFVDRKPYPVDGDSSVHTFTTGNTGDLILVNHIQSDEKLRNKIVAYGADQISASASAAPPAGVTLPDGFFKTAVISYPDIIDTQSMADAICTYNLALLNRITETITLDALGNPSLTRGQIVTIDEPDHLELSGDWFLFECTHRISANDGYRVHGTLSK